MSPSTLLSLGSAILAVFLFWTLSSTTSSPFGGAFPRLYNKRICLLIAHPDDEAMFFAPTVLALTRPEYGNHLKILCLSSGDADGLGHIRKKELVKSALQLGLRQESDVYIIDDPSRFRDSMTVQWTESDVSAVLEHAFAPELSDSTSSSKKKSNQAGSAPTATIDVLLTFDKGGISNHPNHRSLYHGTVHFLRSLMKDKSGYTCPVTLYTLTTTNLLRKYAGVLDAPFTMVRGALHSILGRGGSGSKGQLPSRLLFVSSVNEWMTAQSAMVKAHQSQMVWFRWGWITIGRYMVVNDLKAEKI
ncbi:N-acetylglucosaminyl-phosphatidylinositol deacetylase [Aspergillus eucalypticola CBS 122712]|uniref:N-acetylglucosaminylphosphatidylinositol deacetylase n=1 Tax=Aspergillus eucalypticola (strain CBS 122712 / IBT 29274) TaxID=1448314 RepID=A0A317UV38_ASPEC|nr:N-acetylglucosaminyl-phosphatidylinositol deacetylase [Aspergillus eucalypticola CBS 122712]PWY65864.1 N-acetylglucosaminyl-phosphatidylinositol deacetylase [Aspergillus eucalypticola CBS 122712]